MIAVPDGVILEHELGGQRRIGVGGHRGRSIELFVGERPDGGGGGGAAAAEQLSASALVTASCSAACRAFIAWTSAIVTPVIGVPPATVCAS